jgi:hypothetical protein
MPTRATTGPSVGATTWSGMPLEMRTVHTAQTSSNPPFFLNPLRYCNSSSAFLAEVCFSHSVKLQTA